MAVSGTGSIVLSLMADASASVAYFRINLIFGVLYTFLGETLLCTGRYCGRSRQLVMWGKILIDIKRVIGGYIVYWVTFGFRREDAAVCTVPEKPP